MQNLSADSNPEELWPIYKVNCHNIRINLVMRNAYLFLFYSYEYSIQADHGKSYEPEEDKERFLIFQGNVKRIVEHNANFASGKVTFTMGINQFTDKKPEEYRGGVLPPRQPKPEN